MLRFSRIYLIVYYKLEKAPDIFISRLFSPRREQFGDKVAIRTSVLLGLVSIFLLFLHFSLIKISTTYKGTGTGTGKRRPSTCPTKSPSQSNQSDQRPEIKKRGTISRRPQGIILGHITQVLLRPGPFPLKLLMSQLLLPFYFQTA